jgi:hypothetical protein
MKRTIRIAVLAPALTTAFGQAKKADKTDAQIKKPIIQQSIASYRGSGPCPFRRFGYWCMAVLK